MVAKRVELRRAGRRWSGLCPFHGERSASFTVGEGQTSGEFYHCFGCGAHGDLFDWLEHAEGWGFLDAMKRLLGGESPDINGPLARRSARRSSAPAIL
jgi:DNA primase